MERKNWVLLAINCAQGEALSPVQLQKSLFLFDRMIPGKGEFYKFIPYNYGPFCQDIYSDAEYLALEELIIIKKSPDKRWKEYSITPKGHQCSEELKKKEILPDVYTYICEIVNWVRKMPFHQLIKSIYDKFPEFRENSVFQDS